MAATPETTSMALFCDFENVALGVRDARYEKFDIKKVLERLLLKGSIVVKKAYCDWDRYREFKAQMHEANFELIEIPHVRQSGKNSADIRMVVDALDLCYTKSHVDTFVIISGDSDFSPLVSKLRENAKVVIGVGVKGSTSDLLTANCDEFIFYDDLVRAQEARRRRVRQQAGDGREPSREAARDTPRERPAARGREPQREPARDGGSGRETGRNDSRTGARDATRDHVTATPKDWLDDRQAEPIDGTPDVTPIQPPAGAEAAEPVVETVQARTDPAQTGPIESVQASDDTGAPAPAPAARRGTRRRRSVAVPDVPATDDGTAATGATVAAVEAVAVATETAGQQEIGAATAAANGERLGGGDGDGVVDDDSAIPDAFFDDDDTVDVGRPYRSRHPGHDALPGADADGDGDSIGSDGGLTSTDNRPPESVRRQEAIDLVVETVEALITERGADDKIWGSMVKQTLKRRRPGFAETYYGYRSFNELLEDARKRNLLALDHDEKSGGYVITLL